MLDLKLLPRAGGVLELAWRGRLGDYPRALAWSPFGDRLVVGDAAGTLIGFEAATGAVAWSTQAHDDAILALAVHPRRPVLATAGQDGRGRLWDLDGQASPRLLTGDAAWVEHLAWSASGDWLASASGRHLRIWTLEGELVARTPAHASAISGIHWCGEEEIASACYGRVSFWDPASGDLREQLDWKGSLISLAVSPDGAIVACGSQDRTVHFWRRRSGEDSMMSGYPYKPAAIDFDASARLLATSGAEYATVWSFSGARPEGSTPEILEGHSEPITHLCFAHVRRRLATGAADSLVLIWDLDAEGRGRLVGGAPATAPVERLAWRGDDQALAAIDAAGGVTVWHLAGAASTARRGEDTF